MKRMFVLAAACGIVAAASAQEIRTHVQPKALKTASVTANHGTDTAGVLWDQSAFDINATATIDQEFSDFATYSSYQASDMTGGGTAGAITNYYTEGFGFWGSVNQARLSRFTVTGTLPGGGDDPSAGSVVACSYASLGGGARVTATGLNVTLTGNDWIVLTPLTTFGTQGQEFRLVASSGIINNPTAIRNPGGSFGFGTAWADLSALGFGSADSAFKVEGGGGGDPCDLNGDGVYDRNDVIAAIQGDYNGDGVSNFRDAIALIRACGRP